MAASRQPTGASSVAAACATVTFLSHMASSHSCLGRSVNPHGFFSPLTCFRGRANWLVSLSSSFFFYSSIRAFLGCAASLHEK